MNVDGIQPLLEELKENTFAKYDIMTVGEANGVKVEDAHLWVGEEEGKFNSEYPHYSTMNSMEVVETVDYDVVLELTPLNIETGLPAADHIRGALNRGKHAVSANKGPLVW